MRELKELSFFNDAQQQPRFPSISSSSSGSAYNAPEASAPLPSPIPLYSSPQRRSARNVSVVQQPRRLDEPDAPGMVMAAGNVFKAERFRYDALWSPDESL